MSGCLSFFLDPSANGEGNIEELRECIEVTRLRDHFRDDYMLVEITPPIIGQPFGLGGKDIEQALLATRHQGHTLYPIRQWPVHVYVIRIKNPQIAVLKRLTEHDVEMIGWGVLYQSRDEAERCLAKQR